MGIKVRIEIGDRVVEVTASTREEALKAFKLAARGQFAGQTANPLVLKWRVAKVGDHIQLVDEVGMELKNKIHAIKMLREVTRLGLSGAKFVIETGEFKAESVGQAEKIRGALFGHVVFSD